MAKAPKYPGVVLMEFPGDDRVRASTASSTIARDSEVVSNYDFIDTIHNVPVDTNDSHGLTNYSNDTHGLTNYDYDGMVVMSEFGHEPFKSPRGSYAHTVQTATTGTTTRQKYRVLGTLTLVGIVYFATCGGPVGSEPIISAGGPLIGLLSILLYVLFCQIPLSLVVTELCCAFPENGGYAVWAMTALGPFWGFQVGYWSWVASVLNNAIYPGLIYSTIIEAYGVEAASTVVSFFMKAVIAVLLAAPSYFGVRFVGLGALVLLVIVICTTLMFSVWGFAEGDGAWFRLKEIRSKDQVNDDNPDGGVDWSLLIHALFWSFDGLFDVSVIGGEVINPARTYPRVIIAAVSLTVFTYTLPYISAVVADKISWLEFSEDSYPDIAQAVGGSFLHEAAIFASVMSSIGMFTCTLFFQSFLVQGMAQSRLLPAKLRKRSARFKTPQYAIAFSLIMTLGLVGFDFESILNMTNAFSAIVQIIIVICMVLLRQSYPYLSRPMKVPGNTATLIVMLLPAMAVFIFTIITTLAEWKLALVVVGLTVPGLLFPLIRRRIAGRIGCC